MHQPHHFYVRTTHLRGGGIGRFECLLFPLLSVISPFKLSKLIRLPDNCAPYVIIYTGAQLSGSGAQLSGPGAQLSGPGAQLSAILVCIPTYVISAPLCMYRSLEAPSKTSDTIFWVAVMRWFAAFLFRELKKVDFSSMRLSGAWLCGLEPWLRALLVSR